MRTGQGARGALIAGLAALALAGCAGPRMAPDTPLPYRAEVTRGADDPRDFVVAVEAGAAGMDEIRESVRFPATRYCLETVGISDKDWQRDASGDWAHVRDGDRLVFRGRCTGR